jgi:hypothetical protein
MLNNSYKNYPDNLLQIKDNIEVTLMSSTFLNIYNRFINGVIIIIRWSNM